MSKAAKRKRPVLTRHGEAYPSQYAMRNDPYRRRQKRLYGAEKAAHDRAIVDSIYRVRNVSEVARVFGITRQRAHQVLLDHYAATPDAVRVDLLSQGDTQDKLKEWVVALYQQGYMPDTIFETTLLPAEYIEGVVQEYQQAQLAL